MFLETTAVERVIVRAAIFPAGEEDAHPFAGESADGSVVVFVPCALLLIERFGPSATRYRAAGKLVEALAQELRTGPAFRRQTFGPRFQGAHFVDYAFAEWIISKKPGA